MRRLITTTLITAALVSAGTLSLAPSARAFPTPSIVPVSWELNFRHGDLQRLITSVNGQSKTFWYMRYTVINNSGKDVLFTPDFQLSTDTGQVQTAFKDVPNEVTNRITAMYKSATPLYGPNEILGKLLQGEDNAKDGIIVFSNIDPAARDYQVFIAGLSGETAQVDNPVTHKPAVLQKTLILDYTVPGEAINIQPAPKLKAVKWVMK
ncbi:MAG TPA: hypothetical protein VM008_14720 [Phycisphaerae bacterium]|nr:hypothetical protein [Phycisphaerae bacterium]